MRPLAEYAPFAVTNIQCYQTRHRSAILGNDDFLAVSRLINESGKLRFCFVKVDLLTHGVKTSPI